MEKEQNGVLIIVLITSSASLEQASKRHLKTVSGTRNMREVTIRGVSHEDNGTRSLHPRRSQHQITIRTVDPTLTQGKGSCNQHPTPCHSIQPEQPQALAHHSLEPTSCGNALPWLHNLAPGTVDSVREPMVRDSPSPPATTRFHHGRT